MKTNVRIGGGQPLNKAFTLIELLAVIVILAIIALIATPIILDIISDAKEESNKRSIDMYGNAVENAIAKYQLTNSLPPTTIEELTVEYEGSSVECETNKIYDDGSIYLASCKVNGEKVEYSYGVKIYENGEVVYFDVSKGKTCNNYIEENSNTGYNGIDNKIGNQNSCLKFYAFNDNGSEKLNLLLDHNTTSQIAWNSSGNNTNGPKEVLEQLKIDTKDWKGIIKPSQYEYKGIERPYKVEYKEYKARLITAEEIAEITGNIKWDLLDKTSTYFYFDSLTQYGSITCNSSNTTGCKYGWLYDRTSLNCTIYGCLNNSNMETQGYWTISSCTSYNYVWNVFTGGGLFASTVNYEVNGIRPVIEVLKSKI